MSERPLSPHFSEYGRVRLLPMQGLTPDEWRTLHSFFRNRELADWNGAKPLRLPLFLFKKMMTEEEQKGERVHFGICDEHGDLIGSAELYNFRPSPPLQPTTATLGVMIGYPHLWGKGYGREAVLAIVQWGFGQRQPRLERIRLTTFAHNRRAQRAFLACGFRELGRSTAGEYVNVHMEITRHDWEQAQNASAPAASE